MPTAQPHRTQLGQKDRDQQPDWHRDQHRNERGDEGAVDRRQRSEFFGDRIPALLDQEIKTESAQRGQRTVDEGNNDAAEDDEHAERRDPGEDAEDDIDGTQPVERLGPRRDAVTLDHSALQRNVDHGSPPDGLHSGSPGCRGRAKSKTTSWPPHKSHLDTNWGRAARRALPPATAVNGPLRRAACPMRLSLHPPRSS
jgi:hypothetical protein